MKEKIVIGESYVDYKDRPVKIVAELENSVDPFVFVGIVSHGDNNEIAVFFDKEGKRKGSPASKILDLRLGTIVDWDKPVLVMGSRNEDFFLLVTDSEEDTFSGIVLRDDTSPDPGRVGKEETGWLKAAFVEMDMIFSIR